MGCSMRAEWHVEFQEPALVLSATSAHTAPNPTPNRAALATPVVTSSSNQRRYLDWHPALQQWACATSAASVGGGFVGVQFPQEVPHGNHNLPLTILRGVGQ